MLNTGEFHLDSTVRWGVTGLAVFVLAISIVVINTDRNWSGAPVLGGFVVFTTMVALAMWRYRFSFDGSTFVKRGLVVTKSIGLNEVGEIVVPASFGPSATVATMTRHDSMLPYIAIDLRWWDRGTELRRLLAAAAESLLDE